MVSTRFAARSAPPLTLFGAALCLGALACDDGLERAPASTPAVETDEPALYTFSDRHAENPKLGAGRAAVRLADGAVAIVDGDARLVHHKSGQRRVLLDGVVGTPAALDDGRLIATRVTAPGQSVFH